MCCCCLLLGRGRERGERREEGEEREGARARAPCFVVHRDKEGAAAALGALGRRPNPPARPYVNPSPARAALPQREEGGEEGAGVRAAGTALRRGKGRPMARTERWRRGARWWWKGGEGETAVFRRGLAL